MKSLRIALVLSCFFPLCLTIYANPEGRIKGYGSAFFVSPEGHLLTAHHVVEGDGFVVIVFEGRNYPAKILGYDEPNDLALLKIEARNTPYLKLCNPEDVKVGQDVLATGFPNPSVQGNEVKLTGGMVNCLSGVHGSKNQIQTSAPIQPGNSGGPLVSRQTGEVIGVIVSTLKNQPRLGSIPQCVNYAIKSQLALPLMVPYGQINYSKPEGKPIDLVLAATAQVMKTESNPGSDMERQLSEFIYSWFEGEQRASMFSPRLEMFFKDVDVPRDQVVASLAQHKTDWPARSFKINSHDIHKFDPNTYGMSVDYTYELKSGAMKNAGNASILFKVKHIDRQLSISSIVEMKRSSALFSNGSPSSCLDSEPREKRVWSPYTYAKK